MKLSIHPDDRIGAESHEPEKKKKTKRKPPSPPRPPRHRKSISLWMLKWCFILFIWISFVGGCGVFWYSYDLPDITKLQKTERRPSLTILAKDGTKLATYGDLHSQMLDIKTLPPHIPQAFLAIEDHRFYSHFGVDLIGLVRAIWINYRAGHVVQGGSTITQQLAKNFLQSQGLYGINDRSLRRKIQEALLAVWLEYKFTKDQIFTIYLNRVYLGSGTFGLGAAAQHYFGKHPKNLTLYEAAVIAGLLKAPSKYSPSNNPDLADQRAAQVLGNMAKEGFISEDLRQASLALASSTASHFRGSAIRYFTDWVVDIVPSYVKAADQDLIITTTLDPTLQSLAESKLQEVLEEQGKASNMSQMSLVSMTHEGAIRALVGGADYKKSQFSRVTQALRQPGSAFKMILYLAALEAGMSPMDWVSDLPIRIGSWTPKNYKYQSRGQITLQDAMAYSVNSVSVRLAQRLGLHRIHETARRLGMNAALPNNLTIVLGTGETTALELTSVYAVIARGGLSVKPYAILKVTDREGSPLYTYKAPPPQRLVDAKVAASLTQMMHAVVSYGTGKKAAIDRFCAGKTGTTQLYKDLWFIGFTPELVTGVWAGNDDNTSLDPKAGSPSVKLWRLFMAETPRSVPSFYSVEPRETVSSMPPAEREAVEPSGGLLDQLIDELFGG
ncbi:MAG: PBP1A family penicillin-binding protein [Alphaproteobacteria bacterium]|nr:PBP1A family penicillin-binding protein [Alphaproteobacteria bacterium]